MIEFTGTFKDISIDYQSRKPLLTFNINEDPGDISSLLEHQLKIKVGRYVAKRSNNANRYYWELVGKLSDELSKEGTYYSAARIHNENLRTMWHMIMKRVDGSFDLSMIKDTDQAEREVMEDVDVHRMPVPLDVFPGFDPVENSNGTKFRWYLGLRGSSTFDSTEFSRLLDILIERCKEQGIQTDTPDEISRIKSLWEKKNGNKAE